MITIKAKVPDHLKVAFSERKVVNVCGDTNTAFQTLLLWLWVKDSCCWISKHPYRAQEQLEEVFELYPRLERTRIDFLSPRDLNFNDYKYCVLENPDEIPNCVAWAREHVTEQIRLLSPPKKKTAGQLIDTLGLSLEARKDLLLQVRAGECETYTEYDVTASICRDSFYEFLKEFWADVVSEPFIDNWHIKYLCDELQTVAERVFAGQKKDYDLIINIAPGSTKSLITSVLLPSWAWTRMPSLRFIGGSYAHQLAMDLSRKNRQVVKATKYQMCFPTKMREDQDSKSFFMNESGGMRLGMGTGGVAGFHAHIIAIDDPLDPNLAVSAVELASANKWINESLSQRKIDQTITPIILIMQRLHQSDPTGALLDRVGREGIKHICIPAELTEDVKPESLRQFYKDGLMDPIRLPWKTLKEKRKIGQYMYAGQYLQSPTMPSGGMFRWERITVRKPPSDRKFTRIVRYWDKAGTEGGGAWTVGVKMGSFEDEIWILDIKRGQWDSAKREHIIRQTAEMDGVGCIVAIEQEPGSGGKESAQYTVKNLRGWSVKVDRPRGNKTMRADPYSTQVNDCNVYMVPAEWNITYLDELRYFPMSKFKDQVDASSGAFKWLTIQRIRIGGGFNK